LRGWFFLGLYSLEATEAVQYAGLISLLANKARAAVRELDSQASTQIIITMDKYIGDQLTG
jgi:hypothetical protein